MLHSLSNSTSLVFLAPVGARIADAFQRATGNYSLHESLTARMQRMRGRLYLADGAITRDDLSPDGRHILPADDQSWHLLSVTESGEVFACTRYLEHAPDTDFGRLRLSHSPLAKSERWAQPLRSAVRRDLRAARAAGFSYIEVGGWAIAERGPLYGRMPAQCAGNLRLVSADGRCLGHQHGDGTKRIGFHPAAAGRPRAALERLGDPALSRSWVWLPDADAAIRLPPAQSAV